MDHDSSFTNSIKQQGLELLFNVIGVIKQEPEAAYKTVCQLINLPTNIRDVIFWDSFKSFLLNVYDYDENGLPRNTYSIKLSEMLAEITPNDENGYLGNVDKLNENAKRLILLIDDAGTIQKSVYLANLTRAVLNGNIDRTKFFKLCNCVRMLTEEDLEFLIIDIQRIGTSTIKEERDTIDDFRSVGLLNEVDGGFAYTKRAFELLCFGLRYENSVKIPDDIQKRMLSSKFPLRYQEFNGGIAFY